MRVDLAVVGAGPAGLSAAVAAREKGINVIVIDEGLEPGGRLLSQVHVDPSKPVTERIWIGRTVASSLVRRAEKLGVRLMMATTVWGLFRSGELWSVMLNSGGPSEVLARAVLIATGSAEQPLPVPGWTLPGVITAGAAQVMVNQWRVRPGHRAFIVGMDPLAFATVHGLTMAGVRVLGIANPPPGVPAGDQGVPREVLGRLADLSHLAPSVLMRLGGPVSRSRAVARLACALYVRPVLRVWGAAVMLRHAVVEVEGDAEVSHVVLSPQRPDGTVAGGIRQRVPVDTVCLAGGLAPLTELAAVAGCKFTYLPELGGHVPLHGPFGQTTLPGIFVAGNVTGVESAPVVAEQGGLAGQAIGLLLNGESRDTVEAATAAAGVRVCRARDQASLRFLPGVVEGRRAMEHAWKRGHWDGVTAP